jgi:hypothetical protein
MLYLRTASGSFISSTIIVGLAPQHGEDGKTAGWMAVRADGSTTPLATFFSAPGRIEKALPHLFPSQHQSQSRPPVIGGGLSLSARRSRAGSRPIVPVP